MGELLVHCPQSRLSVNNSDISGGSHRLNGLPLTNNKPDCAWQGALSSREHHVEHDCGFTMVACPNAAKGCTDQVQRRGLAVHLEACLYAPVACAKCGLADVCRDQMTAHLDECMFLRICCENGCGARYLRQLKNAHEAVCPQAVVTCPFACHGCDVTGALRRCDHDRHQVEAATKHSELIAVGLASLKKEVAIIKKNTGNGEAKFVWHASIDKMRTSPKLTLNSKKFSVHVPGAGEYRGYLQICVEVEGRIGFYMYVNEGPTFPVFVEYADVACGADHSLKLFSQFPFNRGVGRGVFNFLSDKEADATKSADGCLSIAVKIKLKNDSSLSLDD